MKETIAATIILIGLSTTARAQHKGVILDLENRQPVAGAIIYTNNNKTYYTDARGHYYITDAAARSVTVTGKGYVNRSVNISALGDTLGLIPRAITLNTVVITAKRKEIAGGAFASENVNKMLFSDPLASPKKPSGMSFLGTNMGPRPKVSKKLRRKVKDVLDSY